MASVPPPDGAEAAMPLGLRALTTRSPLLRPRLGVVARQAISFGRIVGVSGTVRREAVPGSGPALDVVRLPEGLWPLPAEVEDPMSAAVAADPGMAAIARLYQRNSRPRRAEPVRRGLPSSTRRGALSATGALTGPTAVAKRLQPAEVRVRRNESHGEATKAPSRSSSSARGSRPSSTAAPAPAPRTASNEVRRTPAASPAPAAGSRAALTQAAEAYGRADTPDARAAAFAAAMGLAAKPATTGETFRPPSAGATTPDVVERSTFGSRQAMWAVAAGRDAESTDDDGGDDDGPGGGGGSSRVRPGGNGGVRNPAGRFARTTEQAGDSRRSAPPPAGATRTTARPASPTSAPADTATATARRHLPRDTAARPGWRGGLPSVQRAAVVPNRFASVAPEPAVDATPLAAPASLPRRTAVRGVRLEHAGRALQPGSIRRASSPAVDAPTAGIPEPARLGAAATPAAVAAVTAERRASAAWSATSSPTPATPVGRGSSAAARSNPSTPGGSSSPAAVQRSIPSGSTASGAAPSRVRATPSGSTSSSAPTGRNTGSAATSGRVVPGVPAAGSPASASSGGATSSSSPASASSRGAATSSPSVAWSGTPTSSSSPSAAAGGAATAARPAGSSSGDSSNRSGSASAPSSGPATSTVAGVVGRRQPVVRRVATVAGRPAGIVVRAAGGNVDGDMPPAAPPAGFSDPWTTINRRAAALPLAARQTMAAALGAGSSAVVDDNAATAPVGPVGGNRLPPPVAGTIAASTVPTAPGSTPTLPPVVVQRQAAVDRGPDRAGAAAAGGASVDRAPGRSSAATAPRDGAPADRGSGGIGAAGGAPAGRDGAASSAAGGASADRPTSSASINLDGEHAGQPMPAASAPDAGRPAAVPTATTALPTATASPTEVVPATRVGSAPVAGPAGGAPGPASASTGGVAASSANTDRSAATPGSGPVVSRRTTPHDAVRRTLVANTVPAGRRSVTTSPAATPSTRARTAALVVPIRRSPATTTATARRSPALDRASAGLDRTVGPSADVGVVRPADRAAAWSPAAATGQPRRSPGTPGVAGPPAASGSSSSPGRTASTAGPTSMQPQRSSPSSAGTTGTGGEHTPAAARTASPVDGPEGASSAPLAPAAAAGDASDVRRRTTPLDRATEAPRRALGDVEHVAAPALPQPAAGTDATTVRMQERFVETLAAAAGAATIAGTVRRSTTGPAATARAARSLGRGTTSARAATIPVVPTAALPDRFRPLTSALVARRVRIAHGSASRAALRSVGRPAATLGNVVHLASAPDGSSATRELLAHELVHAANAPTRPRFYAEPGHDAEEHQANSVGRLARTVRPSTVPTTAIRRSTNAPVIPRVVQRVEAPAPTPAPAPAAEQVVQRAVATPNPARRPTVRRSTANPVAPAANGEEVSTSATINDLESLIDILERRILLELERRGGRARGGW